MQDDHQLRGPLRFGVFELDLQAGQLRKHGVRVRLQEQPFQVLAMLLDHHGEVVTREELQKKLWPQDTFVDFDHGLEQVRITAQRSEKGLQPRIFACFGDCCDLCISRGFGSSDELARKKLRRAI